MTPRALPMAISLLAVLTLFPPIARGEAPPALPDLSIGPDDIRILVRGEEPPLITQEFVYITIEVAVRNFGPGNSSGANVSFFDNGRFLALVPVRENLSASGPGNLARVEFNWYILETETGNHTLRVEASDPLGDTDPSDNSAERNITIVGRTPVIAVKFNSAMGRAFVSASTAGNVSFAGSIVVDHPSGPTDVSLEATTDIGWPAALNWTSLVVMDTGPHDFSVTVLVPPGTRNSQFGNLKISARATADGLSATAQTMGIISVNPYFCVTAISERATVVVGPDEPAVFKLELLNTGNAVDYYSIEVVDPQALERKGWTARLSDHSIPRVFPDERGTFTIELVPRQDWTPYKDEQVRFEVNISSQNARDFNVDVHALVSLTVEQRGFFMPSLSLIGLAALLAVVVAAVAVRARRRRAGRKTVADWNRELGLD